MASRTLLSLVFLSFLFASCSTVTPRPLPKVPSSFPIESAIVVPSGGGGSSFNPASPGAIGGTTPSTGTFTQVTAGNSSTADPAIQLNNSSASQACIFMNGASNTFCQTSGGGAAMVLAPGGVARLNISSGTGVVSTSTAGFAIGSDNVITKAPRMVPSFFIDATAATTTVPYSCWKTPVAVTFENWEVTVISVTQSVAPALSLCDTGTSATPAACGTALATTATFTAAGNIDTAVSSSVAAGHYVCEFFNAGTATVVIAGGNASARSQ